MIFFEKNTTNYFRQVLLLMFMLFLKCFESINAQRNDTVVHFLKFTSAGSLSKTNYGKTWLLNNAVNFSLKKNKNVFNYNAGWIYSNFNQQLTNNDFSSSLDFNLYKTIPRFYYWGLAAFDKSYSLKIVNRFQGGFGGAYNVIETAPLTFNISDGILYEYSDLFLNDSSRETFKTFRNSLRLSYRLNIKDMIIVEGQHFFQNSLKDGPDYIIKSSASVSVRLKKWISITSALLYNKINRTHRENLLFSYGITLETYF